LYIAIRSEDTEVLNLTSTYIRFLRQQCLSFCPVMHSPQTVCSYMNYGTVWLKA